MSTLSGSASADIDAPIERCWEVVQDIPSAPAWQRGLERMDIIEFDAQGRASVCDAINDAKIGKVTTRLRFHYEGPSRLHWTQTEPGELRSMNGGWELEDLGNGRTRVTYRLEVDPGRVGVLARGPVQATIRGLFVGGRPKELAARVASER